MEDQLRKKKKLRGKKLNETKLNENHIPFDILLMIRYPKSPLDGANIKEIQMISVSDDTHL